MCAEKKLLVSVRYKAHSNDPNMVCIGLNDLLQVSLYFYGKCSNAGILCAENHFDGRLQRHQRQQLQNDKVQIKNKIKSFFWHKPSSSNPHIA